MDENVEERIREIICEKLGVTEEEVTPERSFGELGADSLDLIELVMVIEDEFDVAVSDEQAKGFKTVGQVIEYVKQSHQPGLGAA